MGRPAVSFQILAAFFTVLWGTLTVLRLIWEIMRHPVRCFQRSTRDVPPACLTDPALGRHEYVTANGIKFHCVTLGERSKPLMLLLHGFPEFWFSWRHQMQVFKKDYFVVSVDLRGYGETDRPPKTSDYTLFLLSQDVIELIPALGYTKCTALVGHDWGGAVAWATAAQRPDLVKKLIVMNCPHPQLMLKTISGSWKQLMKSWYMFMYRVPKLPEFIFSMGDYAFLNTIYRGRKAGVRNRAGFPPEIVEAYKYVFSQPGALTPPINYIRCVFVIDESFGGALTRKIENETLLIWGDCDQFLESSMADNHSDLVTNLTVKHIPDCSHWVQQDAYEKVNQLMAEFMEQQ